MDPVTPIETLCRIILRAREYEAQVPTDYDGGEAPENVDGDDGEALSVLDDEMNSGVEEELTAAFDDLAEDQLPKCSLFAGSGKGPTKPASGTKRSRKRAARERLPKH